MVQIGIDNRKKFFRNFQKNQISAELFYVFGVSHGRVLHGEAFSTRSGLRKNADGTG
jgi:hypothetical protein